VLPRRIGLAARRVRGHEKDAEKLFLMSYPRRRVSRKPNEKVDSRFHENGKSEQFKAFQHRAKSWRGIKLPRVALFGRFVRLS